MGCSKVEKIKLNPNQLRGGSVQKRAGREKAGTGSSVTARVDRVAEQLAGCKARANTKKHDKALLSSCLAVSSLPLSSLHGKHALSCPTKTNKKNDRCVGKC